MQELAKLHGGDVKVSSVLGEGTTFIVSIPTGSDHLPKGHIVVAGDRPMATKASAIYMEEALGIGYRRREQGHGLLSSTSPDMGPRDHPGGSILLADDNADMREYIMRLLSGLFDVRAVPDGEAAWTAMLERRPDLLLTDVMMPRLGRIRSIFYSSG